MDAGTRFGRTAADYAEHRAGFPASLLERLVALDVGAPRDCVLDLGSGTGVLARGLALRGARTIGLDPDARMLAAARSLDRELGVEVPQVVARAERTGLAAASVDAVVAGQCWHWFEGPAAAREALRVLRPGGRVAIAHYDWLPLDGNVVAATEALIERHNPAWSLGGGLGAYPLWLRHLGEAGFVQIASSTWDEAATYSHVAWRGRIRASAGVGAALAPDAVAAFDAELAALLAERFPAEPLRVPHRVFLATGRAAPALT